MSTAAARQSSFKDAARVRGNMCLVPFSLAYSRRSGIVFAFLHAMLKQISCLHEIGLHPPSPKLDPVASTCSGS